MRGCLPRASAPRAAVTAVCLPGCRSAPRSPFAGQPRGRAGREQPLDVGGQWVGGRIPPTGWSQEPSVLSGSAPSGRAGPGLRSAGELSHQQPCAAWGQSPGTALVDAWLGAAAALRGFPALRQTCCPPSPAERLCGDEALAESLSIHPRLQCPWGARTLTGPCVGTGRIHIGACWSSASRTPLPCPTPCPI